ncbi:RluA family pseudouridine synthase [Candidatus Saccharibacteria bacterium]|nr:RluA family pseudouridine synthase [Candidatus Saccharibacteria bacterium]
MKTQKIDDNSTGTRFDIVATEMLPMLSRAYVHVLIEGKRILLNGEQQKPGYKLRAGDVITTDFEEAEIDQIADIELPILYEDENVLVINKPAGIISHSRGRYWNEPSVASFVRQKSGQEGERSGIVHRLDRATSGVMICAKNADTLSYLQKQFSSHKVKKTYTAIVEGHMKLPEAIVDMPIERNPKAPSTFRVGANGKPSQTKYSVIDTSKECEMLRLQPVTGRTHQLRVHLAHQKHPIIGDTLYNGKEAERLMLHAQSLEITLPGGQRTTFEAPLPEIFRTEMNNAISA